jgi:hypothetical protein
MRLRAPWSASVLRQVDTLPPTEHSTLPEMSAEVAHAIMRDHLEYPITVCPRKAQAKAYLVQVGRLVPQSNSRSRFGF